MNESTEQAVPAGSPLILFVTGDAPRSRRARTNLAQALARSGLGDAWPEEIDLLAQPHQITQHGIFATPALVRIDEAGSTAVIYGDLSDAEALERFLVGIEYQGRRGDLPPA